MKKSGWQLAWLMVPLLIPLYYYKQLHDMSIGYARELTRELPSIKSARRIRNRGSPLDKQRGGGKATSQTDASRPSSSSDDRPYFVFHIGPPKTATTTLQTDLFKFEQELLKDNWFAGGRFYDPGLTANGKFRMNRMGTQLLRETHGMLNPPKCPNMNVSCMDGFLAELEQYAGQNVVLSDEAYTREWASPQAYQTLVEGLKGYQVIIVVGYRHFFDWIPSNLFQQQRMDAVGHKGSSSWKSQWPGQGNGRRAELLFPNRLQEQLDKTSTFVDDILEYVGDTAEVRVMNLHRDGHDDESLITHFLCTILPDAANACAASRERDAEVDGRLVLNAQDDVIHIFYDMIATAAAEKGMVNSSRYSRSAVREAWRNYTEIDLGMAVSDLDLACPSPAELKIFHDESLRRQERVFGGSGKAHHKAEHVTTFQGRVDSKAFCYADTETILNREPWSSFLAKYG